MTHPFCTCVHGVKQNLCPVHGPVLMVHIPQVTHVVPINDTRAHSETTDGACWCLPRQEKVGAGLIYVHNSEDGRDLEEDDDDGA